MKYYGKEKCRILKEIRAEIARQNDIEWVVSECKHKGNCKGTCPKCEQEVRQLEAALAKREALGKTVAVVGVSASIALSVTGCINPFPTTTAGVPMEEDSVSVSNAATETNLPLMGEIAPPETDTACDLPIEGMPTLPTEETEISMGEEIPVEGEIIEVTLMGDVAIDDTEDEFEDELMGAPVEMPLETETEEEPLMGEPLEYYTGE